MGMGDWDPQPNDPVPQNPPLGTDKDLQKLRVPGKESLGMHYPEGAWNLDFKALVTVAEFVAVPAADANPKDWRGYCDPGDWKRNDIDQEIDDLLRLAALREQRLPEILAQHGGFMNYFLNGLLMDRASHPNSYLLLKIAARVSELTLSEFKAKYDRPRPAQLCPALMPPVARTDHPAYPSGHATMAFTKALCIAQVLPPRLATFVQALAERIAKNREIAGFHYASDTRAGLRIAEKSLDLLRRCPSFMAVCEEAKKEWRRSEGQNAD
jgi:PAP2 superfamily